MVRLKSAFRKGSLFLRKHRKWPHSPYKSNWHQVFNQQQAMLNLKQSSTSTQTNHDKTSSQMLSSLINSFNIYNCEPTPQAYNFIIKTLTKTSQLHQIPSILNHIEKFENFETPQFILAYLIEVYGKSNDMQSAFDLFCRIPKLRCVPSVSLLNTLISVLCRTKVGLSFVPQVLLKSHEMNIRIEESSFMLLIDALCRIKKVDYAVEMFNYMTSNGFNVDSKIYSLLLSSLCDKVDISSFEVMGFLCELRKFGFCPNILDYTKLISFLVKGGLGREALDVLNQMKLDGIKPDIVCYTMVLNGLILNGAYSQADRVFDELLVYGLVPDVYTYNVYIYGLCKQKNVEDGIKLVKSMEELGCKPNLITYNILLEALCKIGDVSRTRNLVGEMVSKGVEPGMRTYKVMIHGLTCNGEIAEACALLEKVLDMGLCQSDSTFGEVIWGLCQTGSICKALEILEKMVNKNVTPGVMVWEALLIASNINFAANDTITNLVS